MKPRNILFSSMPLCVAALILTVASNFDAAEAQSCGGGYTQEGGGGVISCVPVDTGQTQQQPVSGGPAWAKRWGAIAYDMKLGFLGGAEGQTSKGRAQKAAQRACEGNGGKNCKVQISYYNQCGAAAWGNNYLAVARGPDYHGTSYDAVELCNKDTSSNSCKIFYAGCSHPERVR